jgi:peroxiredoxin
MSSSVFSRRMFFFGLCLAACVPARAEGSRPAVGQMAADFQLEYLSGKKFSLVDSAKTGPVVLIVLRGFPGYQCPVCNKQVGQFLSAADKFKDKRATVLLVYPGPSADLKKHATEFVTGKTLPDNVHLLIDPDYTFTKAYDLRWDAPGETAYPSTFVMNGERKVLFAKTSQTHAGRASVDEVLKALP